jgi:hypothetical protein
MTASCISGGDGGSLRRLFQEASHLRTLKIPHTWASWTLVDWEGFGDLTSLHYEHHIPSSRPSDAIYIFPSSSHSMLISLTLSGLVRFAHFDTVSFPSLKNFDISKLHPDSLYHLALADSVFHSFHAPSVDSLAISMKSSGKPFLIDFVRRRQRLLKSITIVGVDCLTQQDLLDLLSIMNNVWRIKIVNEEVIPRTNEQIPYNLPLANIFVLIRDHVHCLPKLEYLEVCATHVCLSQNDSLLTPIKGPWKELYEMLRVRGHPTQFTGSQEAEERLAPLRQFVWRSSNCPLDILQDQRKEIKSLNENWFRLKIYTDGIVSHDVCMAEWDWEEEDLNMDTI